MIPLANVHSLTMYFPGRLTLRNAPMKGIPDKFSALLVSCSDRSWINANLSLTRVLVITSPGTFKARFTFRSAPFKNCAERSKWAK